MPNRIDPSSDRSIGLSSPSEEVASSQQPAAPAKAPSPQPSCGGNRIEHCVNAPFAHCGEPADLTCMVGSVEYYRARHDDFVKRHPGLKPPPYYLEYGEKYALAFTRETFGKLSPKGQQWLQRTFVDLQTRIEHLRITDPTAFERLERDPAAFRRFAYDTHPPAYLQSGIADLPAEDLVFIAATPELSDLLTPDGIRQILETAEEVAKEWIQDIASSSRAASPDAGLETELSRRRVECSLRTGS